MSEFQEEQRVIESIYHAIQSGESDFDTLANHESLSDEELNRILDGLDRVGKIERGQITN